MSLSHDTTPFALDATETYVVLNPTQQSILACYAAQYGELPPRGVFFATWKQVMRARCDFVSCKEMGAIVDAIGAHLIAALRAEEIQ